MFDEINHFKYFKYFYAYPMHAFSHSTAQFIDYKTNLTNSRKIAYNDAHIYVERF